ncbi:MAG: glycosyltransferase family 9 protein [Chitinophagaceae bacterium]|nr:glycosyltransferase family 9 protein [Chitinophagaceae bacterium]
MKFLIIRFSSIGDIVLTTPVIRCLKTQLPDAEVHYLTLSAYREIIENNPYLAKKFYLKDNFGEIIQQLKEERYDFIVDLHTNIRSLIVRLHLRRPSNTFNKLNIEKWLYVNLKWKVLPDVHIIDRYLEPVRMLGVKNDGKGLDYFIRSEDEIQVDALPLTHLHGFIALVIGAKHTTKKLPFAKLVELCNLLPYPIMLLGGPEDAETGDALAKTDPVKISNSCGKYSISQSASLLKLSKLVITHDTGLMHIAAAFRKKIISVWGNTVPAFGMSPYYGHAAINQAMVEINNLNCRPCSKIGFEKCPKGHFKCMNLINVKDILKITEGL